MPPRQPDHSGPQLNQCIPDYEEGKHPKAVTIPAVDDVRVIPIDRGDVGQRLDLVLQRHLRDVTAASRTRIQKWIESGLVTVNETPVTRPSSRTSHGDLVRISLPVRGATGRDGRRRTAALHDFRRRAPARDQQASRHGRASDLSASARHVDERTAVACARLAGGSRPSLVGRLDRFTSGVLIVAKSRAAHAALQRALRRLFGSTISPWSTAGSIPHAAQSTPAFAQPPGKTDGGHRLGLSFAQPDCIRAAAPNHRPRVGLALLCCRLLTGRTHQIRVHLAARGWPIVGDTKYGKPLWAEIEDRSLSAVLQAFPRQALHAWRVSFEHPIAHTVVCEATPPEDFQRLLNDANLR